MHGLLRQTIKRGAALTASLVLALQAFMPLAVSGQGNPDNTNEVPFWCAANYDGGVKFDNPNDATISNIHADFSLDDEEVDISSTSVNKTVKLVVVKAGSSGGDDGLGNEVYSTPPFNDLTAPSRKDISHVIVCYDEVSYGKIKVNKKVDTDGNGVYDGSNGTANTLGFDWGIDNETPARDMGTTALQVTPGQHAVTENTISGFAFSGWYYTQLEDNSGQHQENCTYPRGTTLPVPVSVVKDTVTEVTFCNKKVILKKGSVKVHKLYDAEGDDTYGGDDNSANSLGFRWGLDGQTPDRVMGFDGWLQDVSVGQHTVSENGVADWNFTGWFYTEDTAHSCNNPRGTTLPATIDVAADTITHVTLCNQKTKSGQIKVVKDVINDDGGTKTYADFTFTLDGSTYNFEATTSPDGSKTITLPLGTYSVVEPEAGTMGYETSYDHCTDIVVTLNQTATCTITNDDKPGKLIVKKVLVKDNGATSTVEDFSYKVNGGNSVNFEADGENHHSVAAGTYTVVEDAATGYTTSYENCTDVVIPIGGTATCTITNNDKAPKITVRKHTNIDSEQVFEFIGSTANFNMSDGGAYTASDLDASQSYDFLEKQTDGWDLVYMECNGTDDKNWTLIQEGDNPPGVRVSPKAGEHVYCDFYNKKMGQITGHKFNDANGNVKWDQGEEVLSGWTIQLTKLCDQQVSLSLLQLRDDTNDCTETTVEDVTDSNGQFAFTNLEDGTYEVCEVQKDGWTQTYPGLDECWRVVIESSDEVVDFGNKAKNPGHVLGETTPTPKVLANTGTSLVQGIFVGIIILGAASGVTYVSRRPRTSGR